MFILCYHQRISMALGKPLNTLISLLLLLSPYTGYHLKQIQTIGYMQFFYSLFFLVSYLWECKTLCETLAAPTHSVR